jgi:hypothetical protein
LNREVKGVREGDKYMTTAQAERTSIKTLRQVTLLNLKSNPELQEEHEPDQEQKDPDRRLQAPGNWLCGCD